MTDPTDEFAPDRLLREALEHIVRLKAGEPTRADLDALQHWRNQDPAHEEAFRRAVRVWRSAGRAAQELAEEESNAARRSANLAQPVSTRRAALGGLAAAAAAAAAGYYVVLRPPLGLWPSLGELSADYRTGKGEQRDVVLASNISLKLNTLTSIAVRSRRDKPQIELISGEVSVTAKGAGDAPFVVVAAAGRTTASQANFDVRCIGGIVSVSCLLGTAQVELNGRNVRLSENQQVSYSAQRGLGEPVLLDPVQATAWQDGLLVVRDRTLAEVVAEVNRYRPGVIIIANGELARRVVNGTFHINQLQSFVAQVHQLFGARVVSLPGGIVLLG